MNILFLGYDRSETKIIDFLEADGNIVTCISPLEDIESTNDVDMIISYGYKKIINKKLIDKFKNRIINVHISLLPRGRGMYPNFWNALENNRGGVTIHYIDEGIDTGDVLTQALAPSFTDKHTLRTSYMILRAIADVHFMKQWHNILSGNIRLRKQSKEEEHISYHTKKEGEELFYLLGDEGWDCKISDLRERYNNDRK